MNCPTCGHTPPAGSAFCNGCGARMELVCSACGSMPPPDSHFCNGCGAALDAAQAPPAAAAPERSPADYTPKHLADKILQSKAALEGERKQVTVLFADVKGSMDLAESLDAEDLHRIMDRFFEILADGVHRFEGTVNQYTGDGIMALFGAPVAHEDHAQRACLAALHLRDALRGFANELRLERGLSFAARLGLNSGDVVVGKIGDDLRMDYTAQGQTVGLAARMEQIAEPGEVYLTENTQTLARGYMELEDLGAARVKGSSGPIRTFALRGVGQVRTRLDASRARGLTRFVGRVDESALLDAALERTLAGEGQVIGIVAEAGTGKSRLCFEFAERARARGLVVNEGYGVAHGKNLPLHPHLQLLRSAFEIREQDSDQQAREKIAGRLVLRDDSLRDVLPIVFDLMRVPDPETPPIEMDAHERERLMADVVRRILQGRSEREPAVLLLEDLHWFDHASNELLDHMVEAVPGTRTLLLTNFRPGHRADWMQKSTYQQLVLQPLGPDDIANLVADLLGSDDSLGDLAARLQDRSGGNPFFIEELVHALVEAGDLEGERGAYRLTRALDTLRMPATVQAVLAARIDRLAEREKRVLQSASVIGRTFSELHLRAIAGLLDRELGESLRTLVSGEFVYEESLYPVVEYTFKHALTQDVAYGSQLAESRKHLHAELAREIEAESPDKSAENASLLAHHWEAAGEAFAAAEWYERAAVHASRNHAVATGYWERVRELLGEDPEPGPATALVLRARGTLLVLAARTGRDFGEWERELDTARAFARRSGDKEGLLRVLVAAVYSAFIRGHGARFADATEDAARLAGETGSPALRASAAYLVGMHETYFGNVSHAVESFGRGIGLLPESGAIGTEILGVDLSVVMRTFQGLALSISGRPLEGRAVCLDSWRRARETGEASAMAAAAVSLSLSEAAFGPGDACLEVCRSAHAAAEERASVGSRIAALVGLGTAERLAGDPGSAVPLLERALELMRTSGSFVMARSFGQLELAGSLREAGNVERAVEVAEHSVATSLEQRTALWLGAALVELGRCLLARSGSSVAEEVRDVAQRARAEIERAGASGYAPRLVELEAHTLLVEGDTSRGREELARARTMYASIGAAGHVERLDREDAS